MSALNLLSSPWGLILMEEKNSSILSFLKKTLLKLQLSDSYYFEPVELFEEKLVSYQDLFVLKIFLNIEIRLKNEYVIAVLVRWGSVKVLIKAMQAFPQKISLRTVLRTRKFVTLTVDIQNIFLVNIFYQHPLKTSLKVH